MARPKTKSDYDPKKPGYMKMDQMKRSQKLVDRKKNSRGKATGRGK